MGADLCHQENLFAASAPERPAQDGLSLAVVILPCVVEESNAGVDRLVDELHCRVQGRHIAEMMTTHPDSGDVRTRAPKFPIDHVWRLPCRRCCSFLDTRDAGYRSNSTCTDFEKDPSTCFHLYASNFTSRLEMRPGSRLLATRRILLERLNVPHALLVFPGENHPLNKNPWHGYIKVREELKWLAGDG